MASKLALISKCRVLSQQCQFGAGDYLNTPNNKEFPSASLVDRLVNKDLRNPIK